MQQKAWFCLIGAGLLEIVWAYFLDVSHGFTKLMPSIVVVIFLITSFFLLEKAISQFGIGMAYAVFTGIGIAGTTIIGICFLNEGLNPMKLIALALLLVGIIGLKVCDSQETKAKAAKAMAEGGQL